MTPCCARSPHLRAEDQYLSREMCCQGGSLARSWGQLRIRYPDAPIPLTPTSGAVDPTPSKWRTVSSPLQRLSASESAMGAWLASRACQRVTSPQWLGLVRGTTYACRRRATESEGLGGRKKYTVGRRIDSSLCSPLCARADKAVGQSVKPPHAAPQVSSGCLGQVGAFTHRTKAGRPPAMAYKFLLTRN